ncbi:hypothetical protein GCM10027053_30460 [Intrasporangium mesophilum]
MKMRSALFLPIFDDLSDPRVLVRMAVAAEDAGWDGVFLWDHIRLREPIRAAADPWIALSAMASDVANPNWADGDAVGSPAAGQGGARDSIAGRPQWGTTDPWGWHRQ